MSNSDPSIGLEAWEARRKAWTTPNEQYEANIERIKKNSEKCQELIKQEGQRIAIYKHLVLQRETFHTPISLKYIIPILVTGWQEDGLWPKGMIVQEKSD